MGGQVQQPTNVTGAGHEAHIDQQQQQDTSDVTRCPPEAGNPAGRLGCRELAQHRVVRNAGQVTA